MYSTVIPVFRQELQKYLDLRLEEFGVLISAGMLASAAATLLCAWLISRIGPRWMFVAALLACALGMAVVGLSTSFLPIALGVATMGSAALVANVAGQARLAELFTSDARRALAMQMAASSVGFVVWPSVAEALLGASRRGTMTFEQALHWPYLSIAGCLAMGSLVLARARCSERRSVSSDSPSDKPRSLVAWPVWLLMLLTVLHTAPDNALYLWLPRVLASGSYPQVTISPGTVLSMFGAVYLITRLIVGGLPSGFGNRLMLTTAGMLGGLILAAAALTRNQLATSIGVVLGAAFWSVEYPALLAVLARETGRGFGRALAISSVSGSLATFALSALMGWSAGTLGESRLWMLLLVPAACFPMVSIGAIIYYRRNRPERDAQCSVALGSGRVR